MEEKNKLIAEFMGFVYKWQPKHNYFCRPEHSMENNEFSYAIDDLKYHSSWDWLMPVVEKIEKEYEVAIIREECDITHMGYQSWSFITEKANSKIEAVYNAIIKYIEMLKIGIKQPTK